jgi:LysR family hydrogen peroxide-inducible transcriptional activator
MTEIDLGQIELREMLLMDRGHCLREQTLETCGVTPESALSPLQAASVETLRHLVAAGNGCAMVPRMTLVPGADCSGLVRYVPFREPAPGRTVGFVFHERCPRVEDAIELAGFLRGLEQTSRSAKP